MKSNRASASSGQMRERRDAVKRPIGGGARSNANDYMSTMYGDQRQNDVKVHEKFYKDFTDDFNDKDLK